MKTLSAIKLQNYEKINNVEQAQMKGGIGWDTFFRGLASGGPTFPGVLLGIAESVIAGYIVDCLKGGNSSFKYRKGDTEVDVNLPSGVTIDSLKFYPDGAVNVYGYNSK